MMCSTVIGSERVMSRGQKRLRVATVHAAWFVLMISCSETSTEGGTGAPETSTSNGGAAAGPALGGTEASSSDASTGIGGATTVSMTSGDSGGTLSGGTSTADGDTGAGDTTGVGLTTGGSNTSTGQGSGGVSASSDTGSGGSNGTTTGSPITCSSADWLAGDQTISVMHDGIEREYVVHVPQSYTGTTPVPLMLAIHGAHNTPAMVRTWSQMDAVADENGFIVAYPAGLDCWNSGLILPGCTAADDDFGFLLAVVSDIQSHACIDQKRVYAAGISNGSMMAQYLGCEAADIFAAVAGVAAGVAGSCSPSRPIAVFYLHGTEDTTVSYSSAEPSVTGWADRDGCNPTPVETYNMGSTICESYPDCDDGVEVEFCTVNGMGHCWPEDTGCGPGGGPQFGVTDFKASPRIWEFFERHPLP